MVCKTRRDIGRLISFVIIPEGIIFDPARKIQQRKNYVCPDPACLQGLNRWKRQYLKRNFGITHGAPLFAEENAPKAGEQRK
ncbi:MAG: DUF448 domain-containing protein [Candidatus Syntrophosphaera sp.]